MFVGFSPGASPRLYEGFYDWDLGFLYAPGDRLCYAGEQTRFAVRRDQVTEIRLGPGGPGWWKAPRVYITWRDEEPGTGGTFSLRPRHGRSIPEHARAAQALVIRLQAWRDAPCSSAAPPAALAALTAPGVGVVTSASVRAALSGRVLRTNLSRLIALAAGVSLLLGLPFDPEQGGAAWYVIGVTTLAAVFQWWPTFVYREPGGGG